MAEADRRGAGAPRDRRAQLAAGALDSFALHFGRPAEVAWTAPGRVNLIGEHTDYNDGFVLPFAIGRSVIVAAARRQDGILEMLSAPDQRVAVRLDGLEPGTVRDWAAYPAGVAWALGNAGASLAGGADLLIDSDLPQGAGLASSAALECAVAACLAELAGLELPRRELARIARVAENEFVGVPCGVMDQLAVMLCQEGHAMLLDCRSGETEDVPVTGLRFLVIDTGVRHELTGGEYAERRRECEMAARLLGVTSLREASSPELSDPVLARRARHVITENERVLRCVALLRAGRLAECGPLLTQSHLSLRDDFEVSWPEADLTVEAALAAGALGARMTGGGFGGCVLALVPEATDISGAIEAAFASADLGAPTFISVTPTPGADAVLGRGLAT